MINGKKKNSLFLHFLLALEFFNSIGSNCANPIVCLLHFLSRRKKNGLIWWKKVMKAHLRTKFSGAKRNLRIPAWRIWAAKCVSLFRKKIGKPLRNSSRIFFLPILTLAGSCSLLHIFFCYRGLLLKFSRSLFLGEILFSTPAVMHCVDTLR